MQDTLATNLLQIESHRLAGIPASERLIHPNYAGLSLANIPSTVCAWLGAPQLGSQALDPSVTGSPSSDYQHVILFVLDALGLELFRHIGWDNPASPWQPVFKGARLGALTSVVPSTTSAALTSLWTGCPPAAHSIVGYEIWLKEYGLVANMISHTAASYSGDTGGLRRAGFQPEMFLPVATLGPHLLANGVQPMAFMPIGLAHSGLSTMHMAGSEVYGYRDRSDLFVTLQETLESRAGQKTYTYVYWPDIDELSHRFTPSNRRVGMEFDSLGLLFIQFMQAISASLKGKVMLAITADHGQIPTPPDSRYDLKLAPELVSCLAIMPTGEARLPYLFVHPGREAELVQIIQERWGDEFVLLPSRQVLESGLLGRPIHPAAYDRTGDFVLMPQGAGYWFWSKKENMMKARHGSLCREEMLVPFVMMEV